MSILQVDGLACSYEGELLFSGLRFQLQRGERAGLIGPNGTGKTTLFRILAGEVEADAGYVRTGPDVRIGWLQQDPTFMTGATVHDEALASFAELNALEAQLRDLERQMATTGDAATLAEAMERYALLTERFERLGGYEREARAEQVLAGLGFGPADWSLVTEHLSGGQRIRLALARLLLAAPDLLLLDEPTNHLDLPAVRWLEGYLSRYPGTVLFISHDRVFLDAVANRIFDLRQGSLEVYVGNYSAYLAEREARLARQEEAWRRREEERERLRRFIAKFKAGTRSTQAKSREKQLDRLEPLTRPVGREQTLKLRFDPRGQSGREVLRIEGLAHGFGDTDLFGPLTTLVTRGERVGIVGPNGVGKSTLLKVLVGELRPRRGDFLWGAGVVIGYFSQDLEGLRDEATVLDEIMAAGDFTLGEARSLLARFLFREDDVFRRVGDLSGGERNRVLLCKLMISRANVLVLDEPTNHLDIPAREVLEEALTEFPGTLVFVSHDRYFLSRLATRVWQLEEGGAFSDFPSYLAYQEANQAPEPVRQATAPGTAGGAASTRSTPDGSRQARQRALEVTELEAAITRLEDEKQALARLLANPATYQDEAAAREAVGRYRTVETELEQAYGRWEQLVLQLDDSGSQTGR